MLLVVLALLIVGGGTAGYLVKHHHDEQVAAKHRREEAAAKAAAAQRAAAVAEQQRQARLAAKERALQRKLKVALRRSVIVALQKSITKDAQKDANAGIIGGPILRTECTPVGGGNVDNLAAHTGNWDCLAIDKDNTDGTSSGYSFAATVNYDDGSYTWHLGH